MKIINAISHLITQSDLFTKIIVYLLIFFSLFTIIIFILTYLKLSKKQTEIEDNFKLIEKNEKIDETKIGIINIILKYVNKKNDIPMQNFNDILSHLAVTFLKNELKIKSFFAVAASAAPLVGLLGTVWGIINSFMGISSGADLASVGPGIAEALITTLAGLFVAIPSLVFYHIINSKLNFYLHIFYMVSWNLINSQKYSKENKNE
jgi:biopolymer transport protein ExbB/TolQ